jgi:hypothetical protein
VLLQLPRDVRSLTLQLITGGGEAARHPDLGWVSEAHAEVARGLDRA